MKMKSIVTLHFRQERGSPFISLQNIGEESEDWNWVQKKMIREVWITKKKKNFNHLL
jgi:hypothetical protein